MTCRKHLEAATPEQAYPAWCTLYELPITKRIGNFQWQLLHRALASATSVHYLNPAVLVACPFCEEEVEVSSMTFSTVPSCDHSAALSTLWHAGLGLLWDSLHFLHLIPNSRQECDLPERFAAVPGQDSESEGLQKVAHKTQLQHHPTNLQLLFWARLILVWILHFVTECGLVCAMPRHQGGTPQSG